MKLQQFRNDMACVIAQKRLTQQDVTRLTGVAQSSVSKFLRGEVGLTVETFMALWPIVYDQPFPAPPPLTLLLPHEQKQARNRKKLRAFSNRDEK